MPETSLSGRNTRIARNVRRSISRFMPCGNAVMNLPQTYTHPRPHFTTYYSITLIHYLSTTDKLATSLYLSLIFIAKTNFILSNEIRHCGAMGFLVLRRGETMRRSQIPPGVKSFYRRMDGYSVGKIPVK